MTVKVQTAVQSNMSNPPAMVYNQDRSFQCLITVDEKLRQKMRGEPKLFFQATVKEDGTCELGEEAPWQQW